MLLEGLFAICASFAAALPLVIFYAVYEWVTTKTHIGRIFDQWLWSILDPDSIIDDDDDNK